MATEAKWCHFTCIVQMWRTSSISDLEYGGVKLHTLHIIMDFILETSEFTKENPVVAVDKSLWGRLGLF